MKSYKIVIYFLIILAGCNDSTSSLISPINQKTTRWSNLCEDSNEYSNSKIFCLTESSLNVIHSEYKDRLLRNNLMNNTGGFSPNYYPAEVISSVLAIGIRKNDQSSYYDEATWRNYVDNLNKLISNSNGNTSKWPAGWLYPYFFFNIT